MLFTEKQYILKAIVILLVLFAFTFKAVCALTVVTATLAAGVHVEPRVGLGQRVHTQNFMDLTECQESQSKLFKREEM